MPPLRWSSTRRSKASWKLQNIWRETYRICNSNRSTRNSGGEQFGVGRMSSHRPSRNSTPIPQFKATTELVLGGSILSVVLETRDAAVPARTATLHYSLRVAWCHPSRVLPYTVSFCRVEGKQECSCGRGEDRVIQRRLDAKRNGHRCAEKEK